MIHNFRNRLYPRPAPPQRRPGRSLTLNRTPSRVGSRSLRLETLENRALLSVTAGPDYDSIGLYAPDSSAWFLNSANECSPAEAVFGYGPGGAGWDPLAGDWDGNGTDTAGLYAPDSSTFFLSNANETQNADLTFGYGPGGLGWVPLAGDWDGDGVDTVGLYDPVSSTFFLNNSNTTKSADLTFGYGPGGLGWVPLAGDWDADGIDTVGLYDPVSSTFFLNNSNTTKNADLSFGYGPGGLGWEAITGDWNDDGIDTVGLYAPDSSMFFLNNSNASKNADLTFGYGPAGLGWQPVTGHFCTGPTVATNKLDYIIGETVYIAAAGFEAGEQIQFQVLHSDGTPNDGEGHLPWVVEDGSAQDLDFDVDGAIQTQWVVPADDSLGSTFELTATGLSSGAVATTTFTDDGGDFSLDFVAAAPETYYHNTGGGAYNDGTVGNDKDIVNSLEGGDFACFDTVTFLTHVVVSGDGSDDPQTIEIDYSFLANSTGQPGAGLIDVTFVDVNYGLVQNGDDGTPPGGGPTVLGYDSGIDDDRQPIGGPDSGTGGSSITFVDERFSPIGSTPFDPIDPAEELLLTIRVDDLSAGEEIVIRVDVTIGCDPGSSPTGNMQGALEDARVVFINDDTPADDAISTGQQTVPFKKVGDIGQPAIDLVKSWQLTDDIGDAGVSVGDTITYSYMVTNTGTLQLDPVVVTDPLPGLGPITGGDSVLDPGEMTTFTAEYIVTQADVDAGQIDNTGTATGTPPVGADVTDMDSQRQPRRYADLQLRRDQHRQRDADRGRRDRSAAGNE